MKGLLVTPEVKPGKAIALVGPPGCGKGAVAKLLRRMLGGGAVPRGIAPKTLLRGRINSSMANALVVCIHEPPPNDTGHVLGELDQALRLLLCFPRIALTSTQDVPSFHRVLLTASVTIRNRRVEQIQCHPPSGDAAAHFGAFDAMLHRASPDDLRHAVLFVKSWRRWKALRVYWRARWIAVYWHALTSRHMAPGGKMAKRDRAAYEAD